MPAQQHEHQPQQRQFEQIMDEVSSLSTIAILKRHPMYDSLVLVKKYSPHLDGFSLEFPSSQLDGAAPAKPAANNQHLHEQQKATNGHHHQTSNPFELHQSNAPSATENECILGKAYDIGGGRTKLVSIYLDGDDPICQHKLKQQNGADRHKNGEVVYVPINGLLHRLNNYDKLGISIDSRVYAFAMGLKTAERFLTSSTEKEVQEAPPL